MSYLYSCKNCNAEIHRKNRSATENTFCSKSCSAKYNNRLFSKRGDGIHRLCGECGNPTKRKKSRFCSRGCRNRYEYKTFIQAWQNNEVSGGRANEISISRHVKRWLKDKNGNICSKCGWSEMNLFTNSVPLHIDHIDGNWANNRPENLRLLCPNCHALTSNYGSKNRGSGRPYHVVKKVTV